MPCSSFSSAAPLGVSRRRCLQSAAALALHASVPVVALAQGTASAPTAANALQPPVLDSGALGDWPAAQAQALVERIVARNQLPSGLVQRLIGQAQYVLGQNDAAIKSLSAAAQHTQSSKAPDALLRMGQIYQAIGQPAKARATFNRILKQFPNTPAAQKAQTQLQASGQ